MLIHICDRCGMEQRNYQSSPSRELCSGCIALAKELDNPIHLIGKAINAELYRRWIAKDFEAAHLEAGLSVLDLKLIVDQIIKR